MPGPDATAPDATLTRGLNGGRWLAAALALAALWPAAAVAQDDAPAVPEIELLEEPLSGVPALVDAVDGAFAGVVEAMAAVLFYELFDSEYDELSYDRSDAYVRTPGTGDPFRPLAGEGEFAEIDVPTAAQLQAEKRLLPGQTIGGEERYYSRARVNDREVEVVRLKRPHL